MENKKDLEKTSCSVVNVKEKFQIEKRKIMEQWRGYFRGLLNEVEI